MKTVKAWAIYSPGGTYYPWTKQRTRALAISTYLSNRSNSFMSWRRARLVGYTCLRVIVQEE